MIKVKNLYIFGDINETKSREIVQELSELEEENINLINLYICSDGGLLSDCFAIIDFILDFKARTGCKVITHALGDAASAGFYIFILGDKRIVYPNTRIFVHEHITMNDDNQTYHERLKQQKTDEKEIYESYIKYTAEQLNIPIKKAKILVRKNAFLSKDDLIKYNIIQEEKKDE